MFAKVVVELSRNTCCAHIVIVGDKVKATERLWLTLIQRNQWTELTEKIVESISITVGRNSHLHSHIVDVPDTFPMRIADQHLPNSNSGFVYLLVSTTCPERIYVGTTENIAVRISQHNSGHGSTGTECPEYMPWAVAAYLTNMGHLSQGGRMSLEREWQVLNQQSVSNHEVGSIEQFIENGRRVKQGYNEANEENPERHINMVILAQRRYALELFEDNADGESSTANTSGG